MILRTLLKCARSPELEPMVMLSNRDKRPRSITIIGWVCIAFGSISFLVSLLPYVDPFTVERLAYLRAHWILHVARFALVVSGAFMLWGFNWARWLLVVWIMFHLVLSLLHSAVQVLVHGLIFAVALYFIFRPQASAYFGARMAQ